MKVKQTTNKEGEEAGKKPKLVLVSAESYALVTASQNP